MIARWWRCTVCVVNWHSPLGTCWCCNTAEHTIEGTLPDFRGPANIIGVEGLLEL